jgi:hypothetical protein
MPLDIIEQLLTATVFLELLPAQIGMYFKTLHS